MPNDRPIKEFRAGGIKASVWENQRANDQGRVVTQHSVRFQKSYLDSNDEWKQSDYFYAADLPKLVLVAQKAFEFVALNESE